MMKYSLLTCVLLMATFTSCKKSDVDAVIPSKMVYITIDATDANPETRVDYNINSEGNLYLFNWNIGDKISIYTPWVAASDNLEFTATSESKQSSFNGNINTWTGKKNLYSIFPRKGTAYTIALSNNSDLTTVNLSSIGQQVKVGSENRYDNTYMVAVAKNATCVSADNYNISTLSFKQVMSILKFYVTGIPVDEKVTEVGLRTVGEELISVADVFLSTANIKGTPTKTNTLSATVTGAIAGAATEVDFAIFPVNLTGKSITMYIKTSDSAGTEKEYEISKTGVDFVRNLISRTSFVLDATSQSVDIALLNASAPSDISKNLIGFNSIYSHYGDDFWKNSDIKSAMTMMGTSFMRWPGGAPTNRYHWSNLNGQGWRDNWDPAYDSSDDRPATEFTDLAEHIAICREVGATPMVGINQGSGLKWNRVADALAEAKALVKHCQTQGYNVDYYYLDNEPYHAGANYTMTWSEYAAQINMYAPAIKEINPNAKIVINWERIQPNSLWNILRDAGDNIDVVEVHFYWDNGRATFENWCNQFPMNSVSQWYAEGGTYVEEIEYFYEKCKKLGYDHIKLASLEWNVGKSASLAEFPTKYENTIMQAEMLMQFIDGGLEFATFWPIFWPKLPNDKVYNANRYLMDPTKDYELSPSSDMFMMLSGAMNKNKYVVTSNDAAIYSLAVGSASKDELLIYTHSKSDAGRWVNLQTSKYANVAYELLQPDSPERMSGKKEMQPATAVTYDTASGCYKYYLPAYSLGCLKLTK